MKNKKNEQVEQAEIERLDKIIEQNMKFLATLPNFTGVSIGYKEVKNKKTKSLAIAVFVIKKVKDTKLKDNERVPKLLEGAFGETALTDVIESGEIKPLSGFKERVRPVQGAYSIGPVVKESAGTGGGFCLDTTDNTKVLLTNNHVVTTSDDRINIPTDSRIVQPGRLDGGTVPNDVIGTTKRIFPLQTIDQNRPELAPINAIDAAIISVNVDTSNILPRETAQVIYNISDPRLGDIVKKQGRTTGFTIGGVVRHLKYRTYLNYGTDSNPKWCWIGPDGFSIYYNGRFNDGGDSGSLIYYINDADPPIRPIIIGLLFAGDDPGNWTYACYIRTVGERMSLRPFEKKQSSQLLLKNVYGIYAQQKKLKPATLSPTAMKHAEIVLHQFHDKYLTNRTGNKIFKVLNDNYELLISAFLANPAISKMIGESMGSFFFAKNLKTLEYMKIDAKVAANMQKLFKELEKTDKSLKKLTTYYSSLFTKMKGKTVAELFGAK